VATSADFFGKIGATLRLQLGDNHPMRAFGIGVLVVVIAALSGCHKYNNLVALDETCNEKWANIDAQIQRRYDLLNNIVKTVKAQAKFEQDTLAKVIEARASATQIKLSGDDFSDPAKVAAFQQAQANLQSSFARLLVASEQYPDLKANQAFADLRTEMEGTENRLLRAREEYNEAAKNYNTELRQVGGSVVNDVTGKPFKPRVFWTATAAAKGDGNAPAIDL